MSRSKSPYYDPASVSDPDFIRRWSRLKHEARQDSTEDRATVAKITDAEKGHDDADPSSQLSARILTDADMPDIDSLTPESDYADFLSPGVSEELRKLALRKLFHSEVFNITDGLNEYDGDYTQFEKLGDIVTADMKHQIEMEARRRTQQLLHEDERAVETAAISDPQDKHIPQDVDSPDTGPLDSGTQQQNVESQEAAETVDRGRPAARIVQRETRSAADLDEEQSNDGGE